MKGESSMASFTGIRLARLALAFAASVACACAFAQGLADEERDWNVAAPTGLTTGPYHAPTPRTLPGIRTVTTRELAELIGNPRPPVLIDVLDGNPHQTLPNAIWWGGAGHGFADATADGRHQEQFEQKLAQVTKNDKATAVVFFCLSSECWLSVNASLRALRAGYTNVIWYRGGVNAWRMVAMPPSGPSRW